MVDLARPDALIRTDSLSALPRDLLKVPIARAVLTEDLAFYYEQHEDRLGLNGAIKRIAYEHDLDWNDRILRSVFNEPAEIALWRDGKGALRHYALVMRRNALEKVLQEAATIALKDDGQLTKAAEIDTNGGKAMVLALTLNPRRTLLLISQGDKIVVLSDPGLLFDKKNAPIKEARAVLDTWFDHANGLTRQFALDGVKPAKPADPAKTAKAAPTHTFAIGAPTLALGYGAFLPGFKGLRFDFGGTWSTSVWLDPKQLPATGLGDAALWRAAPANPSACVLLPIDWRLAQKVLSGALAKPQSTASASAAASASASAASAAVAPAGAPSALASLDGVALACWYAESRLYSPVFITRLRKPLKPLPQRDATLVALANWALASDGKIDDKKPGQDNRMSWRAASNPAALGALDDYVAFSPDGALVGKVLDTIGRSHPSVADQVPTSDATLALMTPRPLSAMAEQEMLAALAGNGEENLLAAAQAHLPARMKALAAFPPYQLELRGADQPGERQSGAWQPLEWRSAKTSK